MLYLYGWLSCLNYILGNSWWFLPRLVFFNCLYWTHNFQRLSLFFFFRSLCPSSTNLLAFFAYEHSLRGEWPPVFTFEWVETTSDLYTVFLRGPHSELHYCDHFNVDRWIYHSVTLSSPFDGSWLCKNLNKWMSILFKEKQKYHATEEIILSDAV